MHTEDLPQQKKCDQTINSLSNHQGLEFSMSQLTNLGGTLGTQNFHATSKLYHVPSEKTSLKMPYPIGSLFGIYANIGGILMANVTIYSIYGSYGYVSQIPIPTSRRSHPNIDIARGISRLQFLRATPLVGHQDIFQLHIPMDDALTCETNGGYHGLHHKKDMVLQRVVQRV